MPAEKETIKNQDIFFTNQVNAWTGFRNVCEWKKFEKKNQGYLFEDKGFDCLIVRNLTIGFNPKTGLKRNNKNI